VVSKHRRVTGTCILAQVPAAHRRGRSHACIPAQRVMAVWQPAAHRKEGRLACHTPLQVSSPPRYCHTYCILHPVEQHGVAASQLHQRAVSMYVLPPFCNSSSPERAVWHVAASSPVCSQRSPERAVLSTQAPVRQSSGTVQPRRGPVLAPLHYLLGLCRRKQPTRGPLGCMLHSALRVMVTQRGQFGLCNHPPIRQACEVAA
jgi:hypothetical protein